MPRNSGSDSVAARFRDAELLRNLLAMTTEAIICADSERRIVVFNRGAEVVFGYRDKEILGKTLETLLPESVRDLHSAHVRGFVDRGEAPRRMSDQRAMIGRRKNGELFDAEISISAVGTDAARIVTAVVHDVSTLKATERQLRRSEAELHGLIERARLSASTAARRTAAC